MKRALLLVILLLAGSLTACAGVPRSVSVIATWTGQEGQNFLKILAGFTAKTGILVNYQGTRAVDQVLASDVEKNTPPDIAILSRPNDLARYQRSGALKALDELTGQARETADREPWQAKDGQNRLYTVAVKADLKSRIWYRAAEPPSSLPGTWADLAALATRTPGRSAWCLGLGSLSTTGWPGADWVEDVLLHQSGPDVYRAWASGALDWRSPPVLAAWRTWGSIVIGQIQGGDIAALLTDFGDATRQNCGLVHQAADPGPGFVELPFPGSVPNVAVVAGDAAGRFTTNPAARELIRYLAEEGQQINPPNLLSSGRLCFSAADLMPTTMTSAFYRAVLEYLADPGELDALLANLDNVRTGLSHEDWLDIPCGD
ncbi:MAG TPA: extracellular solute-binding protein [Amycolatopsis sp.]|uniref:ABC transporter substrate-binding protein n=1 Tax=Amycolatopsis sp. TaxID=37632 RepID=UPI002B45C769|nr:extracellular solute-binding protein [Amycolatopsis sp.]HKS48440.1 extracellular solute-binding protein [Amycolatopsis sp.]